MDARTAVAMNNITILTEMRETLKRRLRVGTISGLSIESADLLDDAFARAVQECAAKIRIKDQDGV